MPTTYTDKYDNLPALIPTWDDLVLPWDSYTQSWDDLGTTIYVDKYT